MLFSAFLLLLLGFWFKFDGHSRFKTKDDLEHQIKVIKDDDVLLIWHKLNLLNKKIIFCYIKILPVIYGFFSLVFFIFHFKKCTFPNIDFSNHPLMTFVVFAALFVLTCFAGNLPLLIENDPYFNRKQSGQLCALNVDSHKHNLIILYKTIGAPRHSVDAIENFPEDILFLKRVIFIARNLGKIAFVWHATLIFIVIFIIFLITIN